MLIKCVMTLKQGNASKYPYVLGQGRMWDGRAFSMHDQTALLRMVSPPVYCLQPPLGQEPSLEPVLGYDSETWLPLQSETSPVSSKIFFPGHQSSSFWLPVTKEFIPSFNDFFLNNVFDCPL